MTYKLFTCAFMVLTVASLTGCGFHPLYGSGAHTSQQAAGAGTTARLSQVAIDIIPDREGQALRNNLIDRLYQSGYPAHPEATLTVKKITEAKTELDLTKSSEATRGQLRLSSQMTLTDNATKQAVLVRPIQAVTSYNILGSEFATRVTEEAARQSALNDLARQIELNLSLYYSQK